MFSWQVSNQSKLTIKQNNLKTGISSISFFRFVASNLRIGQFTLVCFLQEKKKSTRAPLFSRSACLRLDLGVFLIWSSLDEKYGEWDFGDHVHWEFRDFLTLSRCTYVMEHNATYLDRYMKFVFRQFGDQTNFDKNYIRPGKDIFKEASI